MFSSVDARGGIRRFVRQMRGAAAAGVPRQRDGGDRLHLLPLTGLQEKPPRHQTDRESHSLSLILFEYLLETEEF